jgi:predicted dehydrogenase
VTGQCSRCTTGGHRVARYQGPRGTLTFEMSDPSDRDRATLVGQRPGERPYDLAPERATAPETAQGRFVSAIRDGVPLATSFAAGLAVVRLTDALRESSDEGRWVELDRN